MLIPHIKATPTSNSGMHDHALQMRGIRMKRGALLRAVHYHEMAAQFRSLADAEPLASLRRHLHRLASAHDEAASELETSRLSDGNIENSCAATNAHALSEVYLVANLHAHFDRVLDYSRA